VKKAENWRFGMSATITRQRYSNLSIALHWAMVLLIAAVYACMLLRENYPRGSDLREGLKTWHFMLGLSVLALVLFRIVVRLLSTNPAITPEPPAWQALVAKVTHFALYAFMLAMPIAGWVILSASGKTIPFFGLELPALVGQSKGLAEQVKELHETVATIGYFLIGLHALAALFHHYVAKDDTLQRMIPGRN
jgi:superoxide oxidase